MAKCIKFIEYKPCLDDPDMWIKPIKRSRDGFEHFDSIFLYVDNVLAIGDDPTEFLQNIGNYFGLKPGSLSNSNIYFSAKLKPMRMENGVVDWSLIPFQYIQEAVNNTEQYVKENLGD